MFVVPTSSVRRPHLMPPPIMLSRLGHPVVHLRSVASGPERRHCARESSILHIVSIEKATSVLIAL